jgi:beta-lactamase superfamily II metal-dependent hydrolase
MRLPLLSASIEKYRRPPDADEIEVTVIGPGFGEAVLVHIGDGKWFLIDSCADRGASESASLTYLTDIGVDPSAVFLIIVSHWDDDHCRGLAGLVRACSRAEIAMSKAFVKKDFTAYVAAHTSPLTQRARSGVKQIREVLEVLRTSGRTTIKDATPDRRLVGPMSLSHGADISIWTLSPSDEERDRFLIWAAGNMPEIGETRRVVPPRLRNDLSVVAYVSIGSDAVMFGGDLEEEGNALTGWSAILASPGRPAEAASLFKISHHGSQNGDHPDVWNQMLAADPVAILAPFRNGRVSLPTDVDVTRILGNTNKAYASTNLKGIATPPQDRAVQKTIQSVTKSFSTIKPEMGFVRARKRVGLSNWQIELFGGASDLRGVR